MPIIKLSILIPTYNRCDLLDECLKKLISGGFNNDECEINVSDNASTDATKKVVSKYKVNYKCNEINLGYSGNIEALLSGAKGEYVVILGDDDEFLFDWNYIRTLLESDVDLYVCGIEHDITDKTPNVLPFGFIGDCIQKNNDTFKNRFVNFKGRSNSPHFFARIDVFISKKSVIRYHAEEIIKRFEITGNPAQAKRVCLVNKVKNIFIKPLDYGYYWYEARKELKILYSEDVSGYWVRRIDQVHVFSRQQHIQESGWLAVIYYWFFQLYLRAFIYPRFALYIANTIIKAVFVSHVKNK